MCSFIPFKWGKQTPPSVHLDYPASSEARPVIQVEVELLIKLLLHSAHAFTQVRSNSESWLAAYFISSYDVLKNLGKTGHD